MFALIVVTTATFQKFIWQYKFQWSEKMRGGAVEAEDIIEEQNEFINSLLGKIKDKKHRLKKK